MNKLSVKISIFFGILSFLIAMGVGQYANNISTKQLEVSAGDSLVKLSKRVADILDREMLERYREIKFASTLPTITDETISKEEKRALIQKIRDSYNHHEWIGFALPDGTLYVGTNGYLEGKNVSARPWLPAGLKGPYIGDVHDALLLAKLLPNTSGEAIYFTDVAFPVKNKEGKVIGVLCTHLKWQWTRNMIRSISKEHDTDIYLLSQNGLVLVGPGDSERKEFKDISPNAAKAFRDGQTGYKVINWKAGEKYLTAHTISKGFDEYKGFGWKVVVRKPYDKAFAVAENNSKKILIASILAGIIGALLGIILANRISSPLTKLVDDINSLKNKKDFKFSRKNSNDEISILHNAIKEYHDTLQQESTLKHIAEEKVNIALQIFDQSIEGILITDSENNTILTNKSFSEITGYSQEDMFGKNPKLLSSGNSPKEFYEKMWNDLQEFGKWEGTIENKRKDGTLYQEFLKITTLKDENGNINFYLATFNSSF